MDKVKLLNAAELAERLGTTKGNVYAMRSRGQLPTPVRIGKRVRWRESDINEWLDSLTDEKTEG